MANADARLRIDGDTTGFERAMRRVSGLGEKTGNKLTTDFRAAAGALGVALSGAVFVNWIRGAADAADQLGKLSTRIGVDTKNLAGWRLAASEAGVEFQTLANTMQAAQVRIGQASAGTGEAAKYIKALGLDVAALAALSPDQQLLRVTEALDKIESPAQRAAASAAILGEAAKDLGPLLRNGAEGIAEAQRAAEAFGVAISKTDTAKIELANDALGRVALAAQGAGTQFAVALAPYILAASEYLQELGTRGEGFGQKIAVGAKVAYMAFGLLKNGILGVDLAVSGLIGKIAEWRGKSARFWGMTETAEFAEAMAEQASARVNAALEGMRSFAQLSQEADDLVAKAQAQAEAAAGKGGQPAGGNVTIGGAPEFDPAKVADFELNMQATLAEKRREQLNRDLQAETDIYMKNYGDQVAAAADKEKQIAAERVRAEEEVAAAIQTLKQGAFDKTVNLLQVLGTKHKAAAKAAIILEKGKALFDIFVSTRAAAAKALATYGPTPIGYAAAAAAIAYGAIQASAVMGAGISSVSQVGSAPTGSAANPAFTRESATYGDQDKAGAASSKSVQVIVTGNVGFTPAIIDQIVDGIREATDGRDVVLFSSSSRQALELAPAGG